MLVHFSKYHGTGNDFIMIDGRRQDCSSLDMKLIHRLCDRRFGVGGDGLILLEESLSSDFTMRYFNADGREGSMCGNGGRCITAFAHKLGIISRQTTFEGNDGKHTASIDSGGLIRLKLVDVKKVERLEDGFLLDTGSPHFVQFIDKLDELDVQRKGAEIRHQSRFGLEGVNVNFVESGKTTGNIAVRTFERGVEDETWSCGTGVSAAAISAGIHLGSDNLSFQIRTRGGSLQVDFRTNDQKEFTDIFLTGPASHVYDGTIEIIV
jgi:diaminopimelate epimerase